jgi:cellulose synthase/poly-beta-1,6-N-acetylglucosamine synthase-like glycosyltransferase
VFFAGIALLSVCLSVFYILLYAGFIKSWKALPAFEAKGVNPPSLAFSIIIPARNEENNISGCLQDLLEQDYPADLFEIIVADDHSEDGTAQVVQEMIRLHPAKDIRLLDMAAHSTENGFVAYKKQAIAKSIDISRFDWIVTTDADCRREKRWLNTLAAFIQNEEPVLVSAPVCFEPADTFFREAQALEFLGLIGIGAASMQNGHPNMCNGANLAYRKENFYAVEGFEGINDLASGDDELLMHKLFSRWPDKIRFLKNREAMVRTSPAFSLKELIAQRKRWVSKSRKYSNKKITAVLATAYLFNFFILLTLLLSFWDAHFLRLFGCLLAAKLIPEYLFLKKITKFFGLEKLMRVFTGGSLLHILYVLFIGIYGNFGRYNWKGRKVV